MIRPPDNDLKYEKEDRSVNEVMMIDAEHFKNVDDEGIDFSDNDHMIKVKSSVESGFIKDSSLSRHMRLSNK